MTISNQLASLLRLIELLRTHHAIFAVDRVSETTGIARNTVAKWFAREASPSAAKLATLANVYGPAVFATLYETPPTWLQVAIEEQAAALQRGRP